MRCGHNLTHGFYFSLLLVNKGQVGTISLNNIDLIVKLFGFYPDFIRFYPNEIRVMSLLVRY